MLWANHEKTRLAGEKKIMVGKVEGSRKGAKLKVRIALTEEVMDLSLQELNREITHSLSCHG